MPTSRFFEPFPESSIESATCSVTLISKRQDFWRASVKTRSLTNCLSQGDSKYSSNMNAHVPFMPTPYPTEIWVTFFSCEHTPRREFARRFIFKKRAGISWKSASGGEDHERCRGVVVSVTNSSSSNRRLAVLRKTRSASAPQWTMDRTRTPTFTRQCVETGLCSKDIDSSPPKTTPRSINGPRVPGGGQCTRGENTMGIRWSRASCCVDPC